MTPKERAAMQQALDALEKNGKHKLGCGLFHAERTCDCGFTDSITALREALAERKVLTMTQEEMVDAIRSAKIEKPVAEVRVRALRGNESVPKIDVEWLVRPTPGFLYAAPVRTKNLTDDEIRDVLASRDFYATADEIEDVRAVIAADREKNK